MAETARTLRLLALYGLVYIVVSFFNHLVGVIDRGNFHYKEILWLIAKGPVFILCLWLLKGTRTG